MNKPQVHAALIKAWADGAEIQIYNRIYVDWTDDPTPKWCSDCVYRIKPEPKPDIVLYAGAGRYDNVHLHAYITCAYKDSESYRKIDAINHHLKLTFDGETHELKSAEVLP